VLEIGHVPATADDPFVVRVGGDVCADRCQDAIAATGRTDVALEPVDTGLDGMDVGVLETGQQKSAGEVDDAGARPDERVDVGNRPDSDDPLATHRDGLRPRPRRVNGMDVTAGKDDIGGSTCLSHAPEDDSAARAGLGRSGPRDG
jgi:hypothetical protein